MPDRQLHAAQLGQPLETTVERVSRCGITMLIVEDVVAVIGAQRQSRAALSLASPFLVDQRLDDTDHVQVTAQVRRFVKGPGFRRVALRGA